MLAGVLAAGLAAARPALVQAHCDTMDGPVVTAAKAALAKGDATSVLRWVKPEREGEIREAFKKTWALRKQGADVQEMADTYFFETLVRIHRAGEGAPYTGLKPAGAGHDPIIEGADKALETGSVDALVEKVTHHVASGIRERFAKASKTRARADKSVAAGRESVEAYVEFVHYVAGIHQAASGAVAHHEEGEGHEATHKD
jgi:hypothetical protein